MLLWSPAGRAVRREISSRGGNQERGVSNTARNHHPPPQEERQGLGCKSGGERCGCVLVLVVGGGGENENVPQVSMSYWVSISLKTHREHYTAK